VREKLSCVNYSVRPLHSKSKGKAVHTNATKKFTERIENVRRLTVLADEPILEPSLVVGEARGRKQQNIDEVSKRFPDTLNDIPGISKVGEMKLTMREGCVI